MRFEDWLRVHGISFPEAEHVAACLAQDGFHVVRGHVVGEPLEDGDLFLVTDELDPWPAAG